MDFMPLRLNSSSLTCSICALAAIILQLVVMECQKLHMVDSPMDPFPKRHRLVNNGGFLKFEALYCSVNTVNSTEIS